MLPTSGPISMSMIQKELGITGPISLNSPEVRKLAGKPSGEIRMSDLYGKSKFEGYKFEMKVGWYGEFPHNYDRFDVYHFFGYTGMFKVNRPGYIKPLEDTYGNLQIHELRFGDPWKVTSMECHASLKLNRKLGNVLRLTIEGKGTWDFRHTSINRGSYQYYSDLRFTYSPVSVDQIVICTIKVIS